MGTGMNWNSWAEVVAMGGYGQYVWGSLLVVAAVIAVELIELFLRRRAALRSLRLNLTEHA